MTGLAKNVGKLTAKATTYAHHAAVHGQNKIHKENINDTAITNATSIHTRVT